ncbi:MAG: 2-hydroxy-3-oxopropionate reductase [Gracilibacteraceae bacterium]|jgi:2-hydroxy-3-oxopropionate reductase|nr:2-hydroxy-3-oxopropionate reductase [Gracilibacteraceae bacterium]
MKIGFIGLGIMGKPMSKNLVKAGYSLVVRDNKKSAMDELAALGAAVAESPCAAAQQADVIFTMLPNSPQVKEVILGENGVLQGAKPGALVIDTSSIAPLVSREIGARLAERGVRFIDAPVSGGEPKAIDGTLSFMVGACEDDFAEAKPLLEKMGASVVLCGELGAGNVTKLANQIIVAVNIAAVSEALLLAAKAGVEPEKVYEAVKGGLAGSAALNAKAPLIMDRRFDPGFRINLHIKDLNNVLDTGHEVGAPLPLTAAVMEMMQTLRADGHEAKDHGALALYYEKLANAEIKR